MVLEGRLAPREGQLYEGFDGLNGVLILVALYLLN